MKHTLVIANDGTVKCVYNDALLPILAALGTLDVQRASVIEPCNPIGGSTPMPFPTPLMWQADLSPIGGPLLPPTLTRAASIEAEVAWLEEHLSHV